MTDDNRKAFEAWMRDENPRHDPSDDTVALRLLRKCWTASRSQALEEAAKVCDHIASTVLEQDQFAADCASAIRGLEKK